MLELVNLKKTYETKAGKTVACNGINLKFADKGLVFITGKSGCGKTTLLNLIGGLDNFDSGDIIIDGKKFSEFSPADYDSYRNTLVGFVFQEYNLLNEYSVEKNINIANELQGKKEDQSQIKELLEIVEIGGYEQRKPNQLSGGQKQRVAIARALVKNPKIVLADEPTGALDSVTGVQVMELLKKLSKDKLIIIVSHENDFAEKYADRIIRIVDGQVVEDVTLNDVEIKENVFEAEEEIIVKSGTRLNEKETESLLDALENNRKINVTQKITVRKKQKTAVIEDYLSKGEPISFIKSKMKFKSVASLGAKSLVVKPIRLIITILLSVIAFAIFGVFDSVASYNGERALTNLLRTADYSAVSVVAKYNDDNYYNADFKLTQSYIDSLNAKTGYSFRGVYDFFDTEKIVSYKRSNYNKEVNLDELYVNATSVAGREYYLRKVSGMVEFKDSEVVNKVVAPNEYDYKIVYGEYPTLNQTYGESQGVGISNYLADSIMYWLDKKETKIFGDKHIQTIEDLIGAKLVLENSDLLFEISAIIDCGKIPDKYSKLKTATGNPANLIQDYTTYLNASCNLLLFMPDGYFNAQRESANRVTSYVANYKGIDYKAQLFENGVKRSENKMDYFYYNVNEFDGSNTILFKDLAEDKETGITPQLASNEILVNAHNLETMLDNDIKTAATSTLKNTFYNKIDLVKNKGFTLQERRQAMKEILELIEQVHGSGYEIVNAYAKHINIVGYDGKVAKTSKKYKVVGIYFDVNTKDATPSSSTTYLPFVMSSEGLTNMGISTNQGIYSKAISALTDNYRGAAKLGKMLSEDSGMCLTWYKNGILEVLDNNAEFLDQFLKLFLYVAIVVVLFSVFMLMNYITTSIVSKRQSIGVLRALGTRGKSIFEMFLIESLIIALINGVIACVVGYIASIIVNNYLLEVMNLTVSFVLFGIRQITIILCASLVTGLLSSILPIVKIVKEKPVALIRKD